jgi:iron complex outermembrane receptor protein
MTRSILRGGIAIASMAVAISAMPAMAEDAPSDQQRAQGEEIVVTAEKREQRLIDVPQSISVVGGDTLEQQHAETFADYTKLVPGLQLDQGRAGQGRLILRGINTGGVASAVSVYMDETPFGSSSALANGAVLAGDFDTFDLQRVEVLRGPQGTFYGASSLGGVLKFVTNEPSTSGVEVRGRVGAEAVAHGEAGYNGNLVVNLPLADWAAFRASGFYRKDGGFIDSIGSGGSDIAKNINDSETYGGRASLLLRPSDKIDLRFTAVLQNINADANSIVEADPATLQILHGDLTQSQFVPEFSNLRYRVYNATGTVDLGFGKLTSSTSFASQKQDLLNDYTFSVGHFVEALVGIPNDLFEPQQTNLNKFTQELRLAGDSSVVDWLVGGYFTDEDGLIEQNFYMVEPGTMTRITALGNVGFAHIDSEYRELAGFANLTWHLGDRFDLGVGGRYSQNHQTAHQVTDGFLAGGPNDFGILKSEEHVFTFSVAPRFEINDNASVYARVAKGFRPGGPNILPPGAPASIASYDSDSVISYELGVKAQSADRVWSLDLAAFHIDWKDIQLLTSDGTYNYNANGGGAKSDGFEFSGSVTPLPGLTFGLNAAYTHARLTMDTDPQVGGLKGDRLPFTPKFSAALLGDYSFPLSGSIEGHVGASLHHLSSQTTNFDPVYLAANGHQRVLPSYDVIDLSAGADFGKFNLDLYVKNLGDSTGRTAATGTTVFGLPQYPGGAIGTGVIRPRTVGVSLGMEL